MFENGFGNRISVHPRRKKPWLVDLVRSKATVLQPLVSVTIERHPELATVRLKAFVEL